MKIIKINKLGLNRDFFFLGVGVVLCFVVQVISCSFEAWAKPAVLLGEFFSAI